MHFSWTKVCFNGIWWVYLELHQMTQLLASCAPLLENSGDCQDSASRNARLEDVRIANNAISTSSDSSPNNGRNVQAHDTGVILSSGTLFYLAILWLTKDTNNTKDKTTNRTTNKCSAGESVKLKEQNAAMRIKLLWNISNACVKYQLYQMCVEYLEKLDKELSSLSLDSGLSSSQIAATLHKSRRTCARICVILDAKRLDYSHNAQHWYIMLLEGFGLILPQPDQHLSLKVIWTY